MYLKRASECYNSQSQVSCKISVVGCPSFIFFCPVLSFFKVTDKEGPTRSTEQCNSIIIAAVLTIAIFEYIRTSRA